MKNTRQVGANKRNFFKDVHDVVRLIPKGRVTSYGAIARFLGTGLSGRMVGWAMEAANGDPSIPAHRVVNKMGVLTGRLHFDSPRTMQQKLEQEGIRVNNDKIENFNIVFWDPAKALM